MEADIRKQLDRIERLTLLAAKNVLTVEDLALLIGRSPKTIRNQIDVFTKLVVTHEIYSLNSRMKFDELFEKTYSINHPDQSFWSGIRTYADSQYNEIITKSLKAHPNLRDVDIHFLCLYCCDLPTSAIMACMGYREAHSVYNKKLRLAKAMGLSVQLDEYIRQFKQGE